MTIREDLNQSLGGLIQTYYSDYPSLWSSTSLSLLKNEKITGMGSNHSVCTFLTRISQTLATPMG
jgi:hypothetical protein